jgi:hypothetical protein
MHVLSEIVRYRLRTGLEEVEIQDLRDLLAKLERNVAADEAPTD